MAVYWGVKGVVGRAAIGVRAGGYRGLAMPGATALLHAPLSNSSIEECEKYRHLKYSESRLVRIRIDRRFYPLQAKMGVSSLCENKRLSQKSKTNLSMYLQWYTRLLTAISRQLRKILSSIHRLLGYEEIKNFGLVQRFLRLVHKQSLCLEGNVLQTSYRVQYTQDNALHTHAQY